MTRSLKRRVAQAVLRFATPLAPSVMSVRTDRAAMALTFDDGPDPASTPRLLDLLAARGARATFFLIGMQAARHPDIVARIRAEGHAVGNHSWSHPSLPALSAAEAEAEIRRGFEALPGTTLFRPPFGDQNFRTHRLARQQGATVVLWSVMAQDWRDDDAETMAGRVLAAAAPGAIVLMHDALFAYADPGFRDRTATFAAVGRIIDALPDYRFVTVPDLLAQGPPVRRVWLKATDAATATLKREAQAR